MEVNRTVYPLTAFFVKNKLVFKKKESQIAFSARKQLGFFSAAFNKITQYLGFHHWEKITLPDQKSSVYVKTKECFEFLTMKQLPPKVVLQDILYSEIQKSLDEQLELKEALPKKMNILAKEMEENRTLAESCHSEQERKKLASAFMNLRDDYIKASDRKKNLESKWGTEEEIKIRQWLADETFTTSALKIFRNFELEKSDEKAMTDLIHHFKDKATTYLDKTDADKIYPLIEAAFISIKKSSPKLFLLIGKKLNRLAQAESEKKSDTDKHYRIQFYQLHQLVNQKK